MRNLLAMTLLLCLPATAMAHHGGPDSVMHSIAHGLPVLGVALLVAYCVIRRWFPQR